MNMIFFSPDERISGFDMSDDLRVPGVAYAYDQDEPRFLVANSMTGRFGFVAYDDFERDRDKPIEEDDGVYVSGRMRRLLETLVAAGRSKDALRGVMSVVRCGHGPSATAHRSEPTDGKQA